LRSEAIHLGYPANFTIYDTDDAKSVIKEIVKTMGLDEKHYKPSFVYNRISSAKNSLYTFKEYQEDFTIQKEDERGNRPKIGEIFELYAKSCFKNGAMDFDDLLVNMYILLTNFPEILSKYQIKFQYILIDEYQDTNTAQYHIIKLLGAMHENICVVGDDAQSIYSFRGATVKNILQFKNDYDDVKTVKLEQNYRSTQNILNAANHLIQKNENQIKKELWTENLEGSKISLVGNFTDSDEGKFVADTINEEKLRNHFRNEQFAVLYRTNAQSRSIEENLRRANIAYRIYGGLSFYQRKEIKDVVAYLRVIANQQDEVSIKRIINYPKRAIGPTTVGKVSIIAQEKQLTFFEVLERANEFEDFSGSQGKHLQDFAKLITYFQQMQTVKNAYELAEEVGKMTGLIKDLKCDKTAEGIARVENVQELLNAIKEFTERPNDDGEIINRTLGEFLQEITLLTDADQNKNETDVVSLMTIHASKGLEFANVFVVGLEETLFPSSMSLYDRDDLEEERRLFYVAITRAKTNLWISFATNRYRFGNLVSNAPSRFLEELPDKYVNKTKANKPIRGNTNTFQHPASGGAQAIQQKKVVQTVAQHVVSTDFKTDDPNIMETGMKVEHARFGFGKIELIEGTITNKIATINFGSLGQKKIMLNYAKLRIVN
nr:exodeoxyribonuclease V subunit gamma [Chitinophagaceae bacterium]